MRNCWILLIACILILEGCKKKDNPQPLPFKAELLLPRSNEACTVAEIISNTESKVLFQWNTAKHAESYELTIKNLLTSAVFTHAVSDTTFKASLVRNTPYAWHVVSKTSKGRETVKSELWKFFNPGEAAASFTPFPADIISPTMAQQVALGTGKLTIKWNGADADNDIIGYDVYFGTTNTPALLLSNLSASILDNVTISSNTLYYWKVITRDSKGNTSDSGLYEFKVN